MDNLIGFHTFHIARTAELFGNENYSSKVFKTLYFTQFTGSWTKAVERTEQGMSYLHSLQIDIPRYNNETENFLLEYLNTPCIAYIETINGDTVKIGTTAMPLFFTTILDIGKAPGDTHQYRLSGTAQELLVRNFGVLLATTPIEDPDVLPPAPPAMQQARCILSVRKIRQTYQGAAFVLRRASDQTEQTFFFLPNGKLNTDAINAFAAGADLFVKTWYDQTTNFNFAQPTPSKQPQFYLNGQGNKPQISFNGNQHMECEHDIFVNQLPRTILAAAHFNNENPYEKVLLCFKRSNPAFQIGFGSNFIMGLTNYNISISGTTSTNSNRPLLHTYQTNQNNQPIVYQQNTNTFTSADDLVMPNYTASAPGAILGDHLAAFQQHFAFTGTIQEIICYENNNQTTIQETQQNIINYYQL